MSSHQDLHLAIAQYHQSLVDKDSKNLVTTLLVSEYVIICVGSMKINALLLSSAYSGFICVDDLG